MTASASAQAQAPAQARNQAQTLSLVSVTRFRARSLLFMPLFALHAQRAIAQLHKADGFLAGAVQRDSVHAFWTMTVWRDAQATQAYAASGAHRAAMPHLSDWGVEASVVRWEQPGRDLPDWSEAVTRMRREGRASKLRHPGPRHADLSFADPGPSSGTRL